VTTQWTRVLEARGDSSEAKAALSDLCAAYYNPVFAFVRRNSADENAARDLTQEFFARLLAGRALNADPERGRFRSYLLAAVKNFLSDMRNHAHAAKRAEATPRCRWSPELIRRPVCNWRMKSPPAPIGNSTASGRSQFSSARSWH
jgi:DNA-directed RNA polymerase specialized sigma24 family protein